MRFPFTIDAGRAAFAVALSVLLYFVALTETNPENRSQLGFSVPVQVVNVPTGLVVVNQPPPVRLWVRAPANVFYRFRPDSFTAQVDASGGHAGDNDLPIIVISSDPDVRDVTPEPNTT